MENYDRIIGEYTGTKKGPLIIAFGAMHGNEPAGVKAIDLVLKLLQVEPIKNPEFEYCGKFLGLIGNLKAFQQNKRFIKKDLNRQFLEDKIIDLKQKQLADLDNEDRELMEVLNIIHKKVKEYKPSKLFILDLHTTSSKEGIFTICQDKEEVVNMAKALYAPIVLGMLKGLQGTTLHYFNEKNMGVDTIALTFESGQHKEPLSVNRAVAGILFCMREVNAVKPEDIENYHEERLISHTSNLPKITHLIERFEINENDDFKMNPGYSNFQKVSKNEKIAQFNNSDITVKESGLILMPLYQDQGEDGYFIVKEIENDN